MNGADKCDGSGKLTATVGTERNVEMMKLFFLDHYYDLLTYLDSRKKRTQDFKNTARNAGVF
jgi:hypothetical protein